MFAASPQSIGEVHAERLGDAVESMSSSALAFLRSVMADTGNGIVFAGADYRVFDHNAHALDLHRAEPEDLLDLDCRRLIAPEDRFAFAQEMLSLQEGESRVREARAVRFGDKPFPADLTVRRFALDNRSGFVLIFRDLSETVILHEKLRQEKAHRREMYQTLRNLMKSAEKEKQGMERRVCHKVETILLPALEKIDGEPVPEVRSVYVEILRQQLAELTKGFAGDRDAPFLHLTRTEMRICQLIQMGYSGKEVAAEMNSSFQTIQVHRRNIRRKLGLTGRRVNLFAFLSTKPFFHPPRHTDRG